MDCATYPKQRIQTVQSLGRALGVPEGLLLNLSHRAERLYTPPIRKPKKSGGFRNVYDTKPPLKCVLQKINATIFRGVRFPDYLTGSVAGQDYISNASIHKGARETITEDVAHFFDDITASHVYDIWRNFFAFSEEVSTILTRLTTKDGRVFQGTPTSSYLANLAFWDREPAMAARLLANGILYSRYVDDITISSATSLSKEDREWAIAQIYGMISSAGFLPRRNKHGRYTSRQAIRITGLNVNSPQKPTLPKTERANIRAQIFQLEQRLAMGESDASLHKAIDQASGRVGLLQRLHPAEASSLRNRLSIIRARASHLQHGPFEGQSP